MNIRRFLSKYINFRAQIYLKTFIFAILITLPQMVYASRTLMFVVDVSGSMRKNNLYKKVTDTLCSFIMKEFKEGDNLILCSFGNDFYINREVLNADRDQMKTFLPNIEQLAFRDDWTYMTKAFGEVGKLMRKHRPEKEKSPPMCIYIFTDGKNEPPPHISNPISFKQIMEWYFDDYLPRGTFIYVVTLGVSPDTGIMWVADTLKKGGKDKNEIMITENPPGAVKPPPPPPQPPPTPPRPPSPTPPSEHFIPKWIFLLVILAILVIVGFVIYFKSIPQFPRAYLVQLDEAGNIMRRYNLRDRQKFGSAKLLISNDLDFQGVGRNSFALIVQSGGVVVIKNLDRKNTIKFVMSGTELKYNESQTLMPDDEFEFSGVKFKFEKGG